MSVKCIEVAYTVNWIYHVCVMTGLASGATQYSDRIVTRAAQILTSDDLDGVKLALAKTIPGKYGKNIVLLSINLLGTKTQVGS